MAAAGCHQRQTILAPASVDTTPTPVAASGPARFIGRWAAAPTACGHEAWQIGAQQLRSPTTLACSLETVHATDAGYTVDGMCTVGKAVAPSSLVFTMSGADRRGGLTISGGPFDEPVGLVRCPEQVTAAAPGSDGQG